MKRRASWDASFGNGKTMLRSSRRDRALVRAATADFEGSFDDAPFWSGYGWAAASSMAVSGVAATMLGTFDLANIVMLFMLAVVLVAARYGRGPAIAAAILNVLAFDFFFVPPRFSFAVNDIQYLLTFVVMMIVGLVVGQLTAAMRLQARAAVFRERRTLIHYEMAQALGNASSKAEALEIGCRTVTAAFNTKTALLLPDAERRLRLADPIGSSSVSIDLDLAQWAFDESEPTGNGTRTSPACRQLYVPLRAVARNEGVLVVDWCESRSGVSEKRRLLYTFAALMASATERLHLLSLAQDAQVAMESERLRNSILAALSHDLRTPLTAMIGLSEILGRALARENSSQVRQTAEITARLVGTSALVSNLLEMARLQSGEISLRREWQSLEEIAESAIRSVEDALTEHPLIIQLPDSLPLVYGDAVLLERVLANLFENAAKYTPKGTPITLTAFHKVDHIYVEVSDEGPGMPAGNSDLLFQKFHRGERESITSGVGLGLSICRAIVHAHGGTISARNRASPEHGAILTWTLPYRESPLFNEIAAETGASESTEQSLTSPAPSAA